MNEQEKSKAEERLQQLYKEAAALEDGPEKAAKLAEIKQSYKAYMAAYRPNEPILKGFYEAAYSAVPRGENEDENRANYVAAARKRLEAIGYAPMPGDGEITLAYVNYVEELKEHQQSMEMSAGILTRTASPVAKGASVVQQLQSDSNLTILDGGPGAGKSFSLGQAMLKMDRTVVCLGSTPTAAAGLKADMEDVAKGVAGKKVYGGQTVDAFLDGLSNDPSTAEIKAYFETSGIPTDPTPLIMVDEAGLLNHKQMAALMKVSALTGAKLILAGDCKQIPNGNEQPFKLLVDAYEKNPAVYANAPYINRAGMFFENVITNGVYSENNRSLDAAVDAFGSDKAVEYLTAGLQVKNTDFSKLGPFIANIPSLTTGMDADAVRKFFNEELRPYADAIRKGGEAELRRVLEQPVENLTDEKTGKEYLAAAFIAHEMGIRAYDSLGYMKGAGQYGAETKGKMRFAEMQSADEQLKTRLADVFGKAEWGLVFSANPLLITATEAEAQEMNDRIRFERYKTSDEPLHAGEPVVLRADLVGKDGKPLLDPKGNPYKKGAKIVVDDEMKALLDGHKDLYQYGYAMDVKATQGMSQKGKVVFMVTEKGAETMQGGEILVGISRNKGKDFEIAVSDDVDKERFYANSVKQQAEYRYVGSAERLQNKGKAGENRQIHQAKAVAGNDKMVQEMAKRKAKTI